MKDNDPNHSGNIIFHWIDNLVGSGARFGFNVLVAMVGGFLFSFQIWDSPYALAIFGVLSPLLFTFCLYSLMRHMGDSEDSPFPKIFTAQSTNAVVMLFDMAIIIALAVLIHINIINYLFFRLLQTVIFPVLMLVILRFVYLGVGRE
jgi:hypothetical protein